MIGVEDETSTPGGRGSGPIGVEERGTCTRIVQEPGRPHGFCLENHRVGPAETRTRSGGWQEGRHHLEQISPYKAVLRAENNKAGGRVTRSRSTS